MSWIRKKKIDGNRLMKKKTHRRGCYSALINIVRSIKLRTSLEDYNEIKF